MASRCVIICNTHKNHMDNIIEHLRIEKILIKHDQVYDMFDNHNSLMRTSRWHCSNHNVNSYTDSYHLIPKEEVDRNTTLSFNAYYKSLRVINYYKDKMIDELKEEMNEHITKTKILCFWPIRQSNNHAMIH